MTDVTTTERLPWHFWVVCVIGVLWNGFGAYDYLASFISGPPYFKSMGMTDAQTVWFQAMPSWMIGVWTLGVWGAVLGTILLILRNKRAVHLFIASLVGAAISLAYHTVLSDAQAVMGPMALYMTLTIVAGCIFFVWYSWAMAKRGVLR